MFQYNEHWLGCLALVGGFLWTTGAVDQGLSSRHTSFNVRHPHYLSELPDDSLLVSSNGTNEIFKVWSDCKLAESFINTRRVGQKDIGNCVYDEQGNI